MACLTCLAVDPVDNLETRDFWKKKVFPRAKNFVDDNPHQVFPEWVQEAAKETVRRTRDDGALRGKEKANQSGRRPEWAEKILGKNPPPSSALTVGGGTGDGKKRKGAEEEANKLEICQSVLSSAKEEPYTTTAVAAEVKVVANTAQVNAAALEFFQEMFKTFKNEERGKRKALKDELKQEVKKCKAKVQ